MLGSGRVILKLPAHQRWGKVFPTTGKPPKSGNPQKPFVGASNKILRGRDFEPLQNRTNRFAKDARKNKGLDHQNRIGNNCKTTCFLNKRGTIMIDGFRTLTFYQLHMEDKIRVSFKQKSELFWCVVKWHIPFTKSKRSFRGHQSEPWISEEMSTTSAQASW